MLLNLVNTKSVSQCILAYYNEIRKLENRSILSDASYRSTELKLLSRPTSNGTCIFRFGNCASSTADGPPLRYYKHRLAPFLYPYRYFKRMKKHNQEAYIKALERRLSATEAENQHLKLKAEAFETAIQIAEEQLQIKILKKSGAKPSTN